MSDDEAEVSATSDPYDSNADSDDEHPTPLKPPREEEFLDDVSAERAIRLHARQHYYGLTKYNNQKDKKRPPTIRRKDFRCSKGGKKRGEGVLRKTGTRMTECPFDVRIHRQASGMWEVRVVNPNHNHEAVPSEAFSQYRKPEEKERALIRSLYASGTPPRNILAAILYEKPDCLIAFRDIYNEVARAKKERKQDFTTMETLILELNSDEWASRYSTDKEGRVNFLFFAPSEAIELVQSSPDVVIIDATYRTNRYSMPNIHFQAVTAIGKTVSCGMCFVAAETEDMYLAAIEAFQDLVLGDCKTEVFLTDDEGTLKTALSHYYPDVPQLLCLWHVNKNIEEVVNKTWKINTTNEDNEENEMKRKDFLAAWNNVCITNTTVVNNEHLS